MQLPGDVSLDNFIAVDDQVHTTGLLSDSEIVQVVQSKTSSADDSDSDSEETDGLPVHTSLTLLSEALAGIRAAQKYLTEQPNVLDKYFSNLAEIEDLMRSTAAVTKQTKITDFL